MSYENLLTERCNIYHLIDVAQGSQFGVPLGTGKGYGAAPDKVDVKCLFVPKGRRVMQQTPNAVAVESYLVHFPHRTDVRLNDRLLWQGHEYKVSMPRNIRNHHVEVDVYRAENL